MSKHTPCLNRREFLRGAAGLCCLPLLSSCGQSDGNKVITPSLQVTAPFQPKVTGAWLPRGDESNFYDIFVRMIEATTDFSWLSRGDRVLLKIAINSGNPYPATTDPLLLDSAIKLLQNKGAGEIIVGDQGGTESVHWTPTRQRGSSHSLCESAGLLKVINENNATACFFEERGYDAYIATTPGGPHHWQEPVQVTSLVNEVDHIIYLARTASHLMGDMTSGMKIGVGFLREDSRLAFHRGGTDFYTMYEEINQVPEIASRLRLCLSSGRSVLSILGPDMGHISTPDYGLLFASENILAHELLSYAWLQWNREFETPAAVHWTMGRLTEARALINSMVVWRFWGQGGDNAAPDIPFFQPGDIYDHPAIVNFASRQGGFPKMIIWDQVNNGPNDSVIDYLSAQLKKT